MSQESISSSQGLWLVLKRIGYVFGSLGRSLIDTLMPALQKMAGGFEYVGTGLNKMLSHTTVLKTAMGMLGIAAGALAIKMVIAFAPAILTFTAIAAAVGAVVLAVDDLYNLFTGGESVTGRFLDGIKKKFQGMKAEAGNFSWNASEGLFRQNPQISNQSSVVSKTNQNLKVDVHVKSGSNPQQIGSEVARMVGLELDRVHRNTYLALVPQ